MSEFPSNISAAKFRDEGSAFYRQNKFFDALVCYNKSLCFSKSKQVKSLAFANRSAVYLASKKFQQCLDNIQLAREHGYPADKISKLDAREEKCKKMMEQHQPDPREDPWNFFKLSYPANKKLPFIVECLELRENSKYGRHIITNRDLKPGDVIAIEDPFFKWLHPSSFYERCNNCLKANMLSLIPCKGRCTNTMFCSVKCAKTVESQHGKYECSTLVHEVLDETLILVQKLLVNSMNIAGGIKELQACFEEHKKLTIFDIDMTNPDDPQAKKKQLNALLALMPNRKPKNVPEQAAGESLARGFLQKLWETPEECERLVQTTLRLSRIKVLNSYGFPKIGTCISLFAALLNHSCDPNVDWCFVDSKLVAMVRLPIKAGAQLFVCYTESFIIGPARDERRERLLRKFHVHCDCNACNNDWKLDEMRFTDKNFNLPNSSLFSLSPDPIKEYKKNCKYIENNFKNHPCHETIFSIGNNGELLSHIAYLGSMNLKQ